MTYYNNTVYRPRKGSYGFSIKVLTDKKETQWIHKMYSSLSGVRCFLTQEDYWVNKLKYKYYIYKFPEEELFGFFDSSCLDINVLKYNEAAFINHLKKNHRRFFRRYLLVHLRSARS